MKKVVQAEIDPNVPVHYEDVGLIHSTSKISTYYDKTHFSEGWKHASVKLDHQMVNEYEMRLRNQ